MPKGIKGSGPQKPAAVRVVVCMPTRGLLHSRTLEAVLTNISGYDAPILFTHDLPIPDSFNVLIDRALELGPTHIWIVEEDMAIGPDVLGRMLSLDKDIVATDGPVSETLMAVYTQAGYTLAGTASMLIRASVFDKIDKPYFEAVARHQSTLEPIPSLPVWGGQDIDFCIKAQDAGYKITIFDEPAGQWRVAEYGAAQTNDGYHKVTKWNPIS